MANNKNGSSAGKIPSFWGLFIVVVVSMIFGGVISAIAFNNQIQDDVDSASSNPLLRSVIHHSKSGAARVQNKHE